MTLLGLALFFLVASAIAGLLGFTQFSKETGAIGHFFIKVFVAFSIFLLGIIVVLAVVVGIPRMMSLLVTKIF